MRNPFGVLGLEASADADQVRAAYRKLVKLVILINFRTKRNEKPRRKR